MNLRSDKRQNIQGELDFSSSPAGEACEAKREETESLSVVHDPESPASTNRWMEEICDGEWTGQPKRGGHSPRRPTFATAVEPCARRTRPRARATRPPLPALRR